MSFLLFLIGWFVVASSSQLDQKPILQEILLPRKIVEKKNIKLNCDLIEGSKPIEFRWYFNDELIKETDSVKVILRDDMSSLMIKEVAVDSIGTYKCIASNAYGSDHQKISVHFDSEYSLLMLKP